MKSIKATLILFITLNGCSIFGHISDETDMKIEFLQSIVDNPEQIDSLVYNSVYNKKDRTALWGDDIKLTIIKHKGMKLNIYLNYKGESWSYHYSKPNLIKHQNIGVLFNDSDMGLFAIFRLFESKWYLNSIEYISKEQMDNYEESRNLMPTIKIR